MAFQIDEYTKFVEEYLSELEAAPDYLCGLCNSSFYYRDNFLTHWNMHKQDGFCCCHICGKTFESEYDLQSHILLSHDAQGTWRCSVCNQTCRSICALNTHKETHSRKTYRCGICNKSFSRNQYLLEHQKRHWNLIPFACAGCGKRFTHGNRLLKHFESVKCNGNVSCAKKRKHKKKAKAHRPTAKVRETTGTELLCKQQELN